MLEKNPTPGYKVRMQLSIATVMATLTREVGAAVVQTVNALGDISGNSDELIGKVLATIVVTMPQRARASFDATMQHYAGVRRESEN